MAKTALKDRRDVRRLKLQCIRNFHLSIYYIINKNKNTSVPDIFDSNTGRVSEQPM